MKRLHRSFYAALFMLLAACAPTREEQINADMGYDFAAVSNFVHARIGSDFSNYLSPSETRNIYAREGTEKKVEEDWIQQTFYTYKSNDLEVFYTGPKGQPQIWEIQFGPSRLPPDVKTKTALIDKFEIEPRIFTSAQEVTLYGECNFVTVHFKGEAIDRMDFWFDFGCI